MASDRECIEWSYGEMKQFFPFLSMKEKLEISSMPSGDTYCTCLLLRNCYNCLYHSKTSLAFDCPPPEGLRAEIPLEQAPSASSAVRRARPPPSLRQSTSYIFQRAPSQPGYILTPATPDPAQHTSTSSPSESEARPYRPPSTTATP